tara:strand:+ start:7221 stop:8030 length:810 start_codon:yes stop_codon:yes gene_type:complete
MKWEDLVRYIQFLPVLDIVKQNPLRTVYKSKPKPKPKPKLIKQVKRPEPYKPVVYGCSFCGGPINEEYRVGTCCSEECRKLHTYEGNKNPYKTYSKEGFVEHVPSVHEHYVAPDILAQAELYADCADEANGGHSAYIQEDLDDLHMILRSEYALMDAMYEKRAKAKYSGKGYWYAKALRNHRRRRNGLPQLSSVRYHSFEKQLDDFHKVRRGEADKPVVITDAEAEAKIDNVLGFVKIEPPKTKSGKDVAELLDIVARKKLDKRVMGGD